MRSLFLPPILGSLLPAIAWGASSTMEVDVPPYERNRPTLGVELTAAPAPGVGPAATTRGFQLQIEYEPAFAQFLGVVSFGASGGVYPSIPAGYGPHGSVGGQGRYQAVFFRSQLLVPFAGYAAEYRWHPVGAAAEALHGPMLGAMLLLNVLDRGAAAGMYASLGVSRSYFVAEWRNIGSGAFYLGLRLER